MEALKFEIEDRNRSIESLQSELLKAKQYVERLETKLSNKEAKAVDARAKPPKETSNESTAYGQAQELLQLREELHFQQEENLK